MAVNSQKYNIYVQDLLKELSKAVKESDNAHEKTRRGLRTLMALRKRLLSDPEACGKDKKLTPTARNELRRAFQGTIDCCELEESHLRKSLNVIMNIRMKSNERAALQKSGARGDTVRKSALMFHLKSLALQLPLWVPSNNEPAPSLCGAVPPATNYEAPPLSMVAAMVKTDKVEGWILAKVRKFDKHSNRYEIDDVDDEQSETYLIHRKNVVPLPIMRANPITNPEAFFPKGTVVNAIYPQTTCFYKAIIDEIPSGPQEGYSLQFEDENYPEGFSPPLTVAQLYVIAWKS